MWAVEFIGSTNVLDMDFDVTKPVVGVSDKVTLKLVSSVKVHL